MILYNLRLIDGTGRVWERAAIRIDGERVAAVTEERVAAVTEGQASATEEESLDLGGRTVIPGLINCHVHLCLDGTPDPTGSGVSARSQRTCWSLPSTPRPHCARASRPCAIWRGLMV